jgi:hypothetical protein
MVPRRCERRLVLGWGNFRDVDRRVVNYASARGPVGLAPSRGQRRGERPDVSRFGEPGQGHVMHRVAMLLQPRSHSMPKPGSGDEDEDSHDASLGLTPPGAPNLQGAA